MDIDTDIATALRPMMIRYFKWRYGEKAVCSIATENSYNSKSAIQMAGRDRADELFGQLDKTMSKKRKSQFTLEHVTPLSDMIESTLSLNKIAAYMRGETVTKDNKELQKYEKVAKYISELKEGSEERLIFNRALLIEGRLYATGVHAGGVVISDNDDINDYVPLAWNEENQVWVAQCNMIRLEERGLLKMDVLGLNTLDVISDTLQMIEQNHGITLNPDEFPFEKEVFREIYAKGFTNSVFQFESPGMKKMLRDFQPDCIEDIILLVAAYRPGPMQYIPKIIDVKKGRKKVSYLTPELEPILKNTYGSIIYQEQVMQIFQTLAGYSLGGADLVRRAMSKKKMKKLEIERQAFVYGDEKRNIPGCIKNGISEYKANALFDQMMDFAKYAFNKSHAASYAVVSYQTAYLKYHYPVEFNCAMLNNKPQDKYGPILEDCRSSKIEILPLSINASVRNFITEDRKSIRYGFKGIKGIDKEASSTDIIQERKNAPYASVIDFLERAAIKPLEDGKFSFLDKKVMEGMIFTGVFDDFYPNREELHSHYVDFSERIKKTKTYEDAIQLAKAFPIPESDYNNRYNWEKENEYLGTIISKNPLKNFAEDSFYGCTPFDELKPGRSNILGYVVQAESKISANGQPMLVMTVQGLSGSMVVRKMRPPEGFFDFFGEVVKMSGRYNDKGGFFVDKVSRIDRHIKTEPFVIDSLEKHALISSALKEDNGPKTVRMEILNFMTRSGTLSKVPKLHTIMISQATYQLLKEA